MSDTVKRVNPDLHCTVGVELKAELMEYYPAHGDLSKLVKNLLMGVLVQLREDVDIDIEQVARVTVATERRRGLRGPKTTVEPEAE